MAQEQSIPVVTLHSRRASDSSDLNNKHMYSVHQKITLARELLFQYSLERLLFLHEIVHNYQQLSFTLGINCA